MRLTLREPTGSPVSRYEFDDAAEDLARAVVERGKPVGTHVLVSSPFAAARISKPRKQMASLRFTAIAAELNTPAQRSQRKANATLETSARRAAPGHARARHRQARRGLVPGALRRHACAVRGEPRRAGAGLAQRRRQGLGHGRIRHAAARHARAHAARGDARPSGRAHAGDPAPDRPLAARRRRPEGARRAADHHRLRRAAGGRRNAHGGDHRRLGGAARRARTGCARAAWSATAC